MIEKGQEGARARQGVWRRFAKVAVVALAAGSFGVAGASQALAQQVDENWPVPSGGTGLLGDDWPFPTGGSGIFGDDWPFPLDDDDDDSGGGDINVGGSLGGTIIMGGGSGGGISIGGGSSGTGGGGGSGSGSGGGYDD